jgi:hypothetical protein
MWLALGQEDTEPLESPLALAVAGQLAAGPWQLYGPYGRQNTLVMIHSPLYYHLAALAAWPFWRAGLELVPAALSGGRLLSIACMGLTLAVAYRLARLDGASKRAGWWSVFIFAAAPLARVQPYAVRPDLLGVALETTGILWVLSALQSGDRKGRRLAAAYVAFGLAICVKLHFIVGPIVCTGLLLAASWRGRIARKHITRALFAGFAGVFLVYGTEELATAGRMSQAVFRAAMEASRIHSPDGTYAAIVSLAILGRSTGLVAVLCAVGSAGVRSRPGLGRRLLALSGTGLIGLLFLNLLLPPATSAGENVLRTMPLAACAFLLIPVCAVVEPRAFARDRVDIVLWALCAGEAALVLGLARSSTGAWVNYALEAVVLASVLSARALARRCEGALAAGTAVSIALAALVVLVIAVRDVSDELIRHRNDRLAVAQILRTLGRSPTEFFFAGRPGWNRVNGRFDLVYDDWLYPAFESLHLAEPRSSWLQQALTSGDVQFVVTPADSPQIEGLGRTLEQLGYVPTVPVGPYLVWERVRGPRTNQRSERDSSAALAGHSADASVAGHCFARVYFVSTAFASCPSGVTLYAVIVR